MSDSLPPSIEERFADLESKISFQEDLLEQLNLTVYRQQSQIDRLLKQLQSLAERMPEPGSARTDPLNERPPHY